MRPLLLGATVVVLASTAHAQNQVNDLARCGRLFAQYERYSNTGGESRSGSAISALEARRAVEDCRQGNIAGGIMILERKLRALGFKP
jgi:hypothetical protein